MIGDRDRFDNTITYRSPEFAGVQVFAQYSFQADGAEDDQTTHNKRYAGLGATYTLGAFSTGIVVDTIMNKATNADSTDANTEDSLGVSWGASYDLGVTKPMILVQYGKNETTLGGFGASDLYYFADNIRNFTNEGLTGYAVSLGAVTPLFGGNLYTSVSYTDGEFEGDIQRWGIAVGYDYPLSKRTKVYGFAAYNEGEIKGTQDSVSLGHSSGKLEQTDIEAGIGLIHYF